MPEAGGRVLRVVLLADALTVHNAFFDRNFKTIEIRYFSETDTLYIEFRPAAIADTRDLDQNKLAEYDAQGNRCAMTLEHARDRADIPHFSYEQVAA